MINSFKKIIAFGKFTTDSVLNTEESFSDIHVCLYARYRPIYMSIYRYIAT